MPGLFLATYRKQDPAGPPFALTSANNGLSVDPVTGAIVLGNDVGGTSATLLSNREIPFGGFFLKQISGTAATSLTNLIFGDAPGFQVVENNAFGSAAPLTEVGYRIRTNPKAVGPFSIPLQFDTKLSNQGTLTFLLRDLSAVPVGVTNFVFRLQDAGGSGNPLTISNNQFVTVSQMLGVACSGPLNNSRLSILNDGNAANVAISVKNGDPGVNSSIDILMTNDINTAIIRLNGSTHAANANNFIVDNTTLASDILLNTGTASMRVKFNSGVLVNGGNAAGTAMDINGALTINSAIMISTKTAFTNGAGANVGTLNNAPVAGNPTKWIPVDDNGTTRFMPAW